MWWFKLTHLFSLRVRRAPVAASAEEHSDGQEETAITGGDTTCAPF
jgi:hypothetical protein